MSGVFGKGGGETHTTTSQNSLPPWLTNAYQGAVGDATGIYNQGGQQYFPQAGYVPFSEQSLTGLATAEGLSNDPSQIPGYADTFQTFQDTVSGDYLYGGDGFNAALEAAKREIFPMVKSTFNSQGRTGSGLAEAAAAEELGDVFAGMYGQERGRQQQAMGMMPQMYNLAMAPSQTMRNVGSALEGKEQEALMDEMLRWQASQPTNALNSYLTQLGSVAPNFQQQTSQQPVYNSGGSNLLGSALSLIPMFL